MTFWNLITVQRLLENYSWVQSDSPGAKKLNKILSLDMSTRFSGQEIQGSSSIAEIAKYSWFSGLRIFSSQDYHPKNLLFFNLGRSYWIDLRDPESPKIGILFERRDFKGLWYFQWNPYFFNLDFILRIQNFRMSVFFSIFSEILIFSDSGIMAIFQPSNFGWRWAQCSDYKRARDTKMGTNGRIHPRTF